MSKHRNARIGFVVLAALAGCKSSQPGSERSEPSTGPESVATGEPAPPTAAELEASGRELAKRFLIVDGHVDIPFRLHGSRADDGSLTQDISQRTDSGDFDYPRARAGGLDAPFMSIYVPAKYQQDGGAKALADQLIDMVEGFETKWPDKFAVARSVADVEAAFAAGKIALPMGIENGAAIEGELANLTHFRDRGVRYITLTHAEDNKICDSSYADTSTHKGLSELGREVVAEMNRLGIMVDISHVSDDTFYQVLELTEVPVIASHSSLRHFVPDFERNMSDEMVRKLKDNGGVIMINFGSSFVAKASRDYFQARRDAVKEFAADNGVDRSDPKAREFEAAYAAENPPVFATVSDVADHIDRVVELAGIDHVGLGSDYDGVGDSLPEGLKDASTYPALLTELLRRGYSEQQIEKICSGNVLRVWRAVEAHAAKASAAAKPVEQGG